mmetsp:Transcript_3995/g.6782  ORF Transcript_3995/g.6782 Transcript_3995/m.6782 type:complete len:572 (-) Transcript_3995:1556-3271(-)
MTPTKQYQEYVPTAPAESSKVRKIALSKLNKFTSAGKANDDKASFMAAMKELNDELIGIPPAPKSPSPTPMSLPPKRSSHFTLNGVSEHPRAPKTTAMRSPSFDSLRRLQQLRCSEFSKPFSKSGVDGDEYDIDSLTLRTSSGRHRAAANLQHRPTDKEVEEDGDEEQVTHHRHHWKDHQQHEYSRRHEQQQHEVVVSATGRPQSLHTSQRPPPDSQSHHRPQHHLQPEPEHRPLQHIHSNQPETHETANPPSNSSDSGTPERGRLAHALQTAGASATVTSEASSTASPRLHPHIQGDSSSGAGKGSGQQGGGGVVVPMFHASIEDDPYLKPNEIKVYSESSDSSECSDEESDEEDDEDEEASALTESVMTSSSPVASQTAGDSGSHHSGSPLHSSAGDNVSEASVRHGMNNLSTDINSIPSTSTTSAKKTTSGVISADGRLCWDDVNDDLPHIRVNKGTRSPPSPATRSGGGQQSREQGVRVQGGRDEEQSYGSSASGRGSTKTDSVTGNGSGRGALNTRRPPSAVGSRPESRKAYELPKGASLDLSGLSFDHINRLAQGKGKEWQYSVI